MTACSAGKKFASTIGVCTNFGCSLFACFCGMMSSGIQRYQIKSKYNIDVSCLVPGPERMLMVLQGGKFLPLDVIFLWLFGCCSTVQHSAEVTSREGGGSA